MTKFEHPFAKVYRAILKEKYPDKEAAIPDDSLLVTNDMPEDVVDEALKRYYAGKKLIVGPRVQLSPSDTTQKREVKYTITYA
jgi:hypothetical protein